MDDEKIVFEVDVTSLAKGLADSQTQLEIYKRDMELAIEANGKFSEQANKAAGLVAAQTKAVQQQTGAITRLTQAELALGGSINEIVKSYDAENKSVDQNRKTLNALTTEYIKADKVGREKLAPTIKKISDELKKQEGAIGDTRRNVGNYGDSFKDAFSTITSGIPALGGFANAQKGVNLALEANPIGAVVALLTGLVQIFSQNKEVADQVSFAIAGLNKGFGFIIDTIVNTVSSFDNLTEAITHPIKFLSKLASGTAQAAKEGYNASKAFDELTVANAKLNAEISVGQEKSDALTKSLKDRTKTEQERIKIANQIADLEVSNAQKLAKLRADELNALNLQNKNRTLSGEEQARVIEKQGEVEVAQLQAITAENQRQTRINILLEKEATTAAKENKEVKSKVRQEELKSLEETLNKEKELRDKAEEDNANRELDAQVRQAQITANRVGSESARIDAEIIARQRLLENEQLTATERENIIRESEDRITGIKKEAGEKQLAEKEKLLQEEQQAQAQTEQAIFGAISNGISAISDILNAEIDNKTQELDDALKSGAISQDQYAKQTTELKKKQFEQNKAIALSSAILQGINATLAAFTSGSAIPIVGAVTGPVFAALAAAFAAVQVGIIAAQPMPAFASGVIGLDGAGTETSDSIDARLSKGESVLTAKATRKYHRQLAYMEMSVGNKPNYQFGGGMFAGGFIPSVGGDGGFLARETVKQSDSALMMSEAIRNGFALAPAPILSIKELNTKQRDIERSVNLSEA